MGEVITSFVNGGAGIIEAKKEGETLVGKERKLRSMPKDFRKILGLGFTLPFV